ncbi:hypothetical protein NPIL_309491 [Nephila pilipes]|uniref:Uncharacterized protein n=1 Tax=Nephila pilipes TaxID=299642 RepID=A0A8X6MWD1_NEPPI|nr:hypothetical protein NPIL_309491 [Nephila pilipes]
MSINSCYTTSSERYSFSKLIQRNFLRQEYFMSSLKLSCSISSSVQVCSPLIRYGSSGLVKTVLNNSVVDGHFILLRDTRRVSVNSLAVTSLLF